MTAVTFVDGLGRTIAARNTAVVAGNKGMTTSGLVTRDSLGRAIHSYRPFFTSGIGNDRGLAAPPAGLKFTRTDYDDRDRPIAIVHPGNSIDATSYAIEPAPGSAALLFSIRSVAANGNHRESYVDQAGRVRAFVEHPNAAAVSRYEYLPTGELISIVDAEGNATSLAYDLRGLRTSFSNPDTGLIEERYDAMGNRIELVEPNHRAVGGRVEFAFVRDRLAKIKYPNPSKPEVRMSYGLANAADNSAGRLTLVEDEAGSQKHEYGEQGELKRTVRTVTPGQQGSQSLVFDTSFVHDSLGRQLSVTYPDGVTVTSAYDDGGMLKEVNGLGAGWSRLYASMIQYDVYGNRTQLRTANGVVTKWQFDDERVRLQQVDTTLPGNSSRAIQALRYKYDRSGNPEEVKNLVPALSGGSGQLPGSSSVTYTYDGVDRLLTATGNAQLSAQKATSYVQTHAYSASHNLVSKSRTHLIGQSGGIPSAPNATNFASTYTYESGRPHLPSQIGDLLVTYDPSGNPLTRRTSTNGSMQTLVWDADGRMVDYQGGGVHQHNTYDASGLRVRRRSTQSETVFASPLFEVENGTQGARHVFAGELRVATELGKFTSGEGPGVPDKPGTAYYFHGDHVGSTTVLTAQDGTVHQSVEYFPDGETWIDRGPAKPVNKYLFSGKPYDPDTGFYDFGQRFYDPRTGLWLGVDPALVDNSPSSPVARPLRLSPIAFSANNPIRFYDPDGREERQIKALLVDAVDRSEYHDVENQLMWAAHTVFMSNDGAVGSELATSGISARVEGWTTDTPYTFGDRKIGLVALSTQNYDGASVERALKVGGCGSNEVACAASKQAVDVLMARDGSLRSESTTSFAVTQPGTQTVFFAIDRIAAKLRKSGYDVTDKSHRPDIQRFLVNLVAHEAGHLAGICHMSKAPCDNTKTDRPKTDLMHDTLTPQTPARTLTDEGRKALRYWIERWKSTLAD